jgi:hypothetical protein
MMTDEQNEASKECKSGGMKFEIQRRKKSDKELMIQLMSVIIIHSTRKNLTTMGMGNIGPEMAWWLMNRTKQVKNARAVGWNLKFSVEKNQTKN